MSSTVRRVWVYSLAGALLVGLLVRGPGILWGTNFPLHWYGHHPDEYTHLVNVEKILDPDAPPRWDPNPYPKGMAAHVAVPVMAFRAAGIPIYGNPPTPGEIVVTGRAISVVYGVATILVVFLIARQLFRDPRIHHLSAWFLALGGLHVTQSHFFLADVPSLFWYLTGSYFLLLELSESSKNRSWLLPGAALSLGLSFGLKLSTLALLSLALVTLMRQPRLLRTAQVGAFFLAGVILVNADSYTLNDFGNTLGQGVTSKTELSWWSNLLLYLAEFPSVVSLPMMAIYVVGLYLALRKLVAERYSERWWSVVIVVLLPLLVHTWTMMFKLDQFPRHLLVLVPWLSIVGAWGILRVADWAADKGMRRHLVLLPIVAYLLLFVYDGEKVFNDEPRNAAARWLLTNVPAGSEVYWQRHSWISPYKDVSFSDEERPGIVILEMYDTNPYLSGFGLRNSYPSDFRKVFAGRSESYLRSMQALFKGESEYELVASFAPKYFMPEYVVVDNLLGDRSRNYVSEIVVFKKRSASN